MSIRPDLPLGKFARAQALERLVDVKREMRRARRDPHPDAVHDLVAPHHWHLPDAHDDSI